LLVIPANAGIQFLILLFALKARAAAGSRRSPGWRAKAKQRPRRSSPQRRGV